MPKNAIFGSPIYFLAVTESRKTRLMATDGKWTPRAGELVPASIYTLAEKYWVGALISSDGQKLITFMKTMDELAESNDKFVFHLEIFAHDVAAVKFPKPPARRGGPGH